MRGKKWTLEEDTILKELYANNFNPIIATKLNRSAIAVSNRGFLLGLKKDKKLLSKMGFELEKKGLRYRFKKGSIPANKGTKGLMKPNKTSFKKGNKPHNTKPVGTIVTTDYGYLYEKIASPDVWELKHRLVWKEHNGTIPEGHNVQFKNKITTDCRIENLYLISKEDQMKENSIYHYPPEMVKAMKKLGKLKKLIHKKESQ